MDALDILARIDADRPVTAREFGYLLPELERRGHLKVEKAERCCQKVFARSYRYRGRLFLWVGPHLGNYETGIAQVKAAAFEITPNIQTPAFLAVTTCRKCRRGLVLFLESVTHSVTHKKNSENRLMGTIRILPSPPPTFTRLV